MIACLVVPLIASVMWLVVLFNQTVTLNHETQKLSISFQEIQAENAELKEQIFNMFNGDEAKELAEMKGLLEDKYPEYVEVGRRPQPWELASQ